MTELNATAAAEVLKSAAAQFAALQAAKITHGSKWFGIWKRSRNALVKNGMGYNNSCDLMTKLQRQYEGVGE